MPVYALEIQLRVQTRRQFQPDAAVDSFELQIARPVRSPDSGLNRSVDALGRRPALRRDVNSTVHTVSLDVAPHGHGPDSAVYVLANKAQISRHVNGEVDVGVVVAVAEMRTRVAVVGTKETRV